MWKENWLKASGKEGAKSRRDEREERKEKQVEESERIFVFRCQLIQLNPKLIRIVILLKSIHYAYSHITSFCSH